MSWMMLLLLLAFVLATLGAINRAHWLPMSGRHTKGKRLQMADNNVTIFLPTLGIGSSPYVSLPLIELDPNNNLSLVILSQSVSDFTQAKADQILILN